MNVSTFPDVVLDSLARPAISLGNFDGVHLGHQRILTALKERARAEGGPAVVVTFEPHPISVLRPAAAPRRIATAAQKRELVGSCSVDALVIVPFTEEFSRLEARAFVEQVLVDKLRTREVVLGGDFRFGRGRAGDLAMLRDLGRTLGFEVIEVPPALYDGALISSSRIREALGSGEASHAAAMLGRPYFLDGTVVRGDGRGATIGFPTANLEWTGDLLLADGVYVTSARVGPPSARQGPPSPEPSLALRQGMSHVGRRPTFGVDTRAVETHLFDFSGEIYGEPLRLFFHERLRGTVKFEDGAALKKQLEADRSLGLEFFRDPRGRLML